MSEMASLKLSAKEKKSDNAYIGNSNRPDFPWGLSINLDDAAIKKLGIDDLPDASTSCNIKAIGKVTRVESSATDGDTKNRAITIQITDMSIVFDGGDKDFNEGFKSKK